MKQTVHRVLTTFTPGSTIEGKIIFQPPIQGLKNVKLVDLSFNKDITLTTCGVIMKSDIFHFSKTSINHSTLNGSIDQGDTVISLTADNTTTRSIAFSISQSSTDFNGQSLSEMRWKLYNFNGTSLIAPGATDTMLCFVLAIVTCV